jgi:hypothetical protein
MRRQPERNVDDHALEGGFAKLFFDMVCRLQCFEKRNEQLPFLAVSNQLIDFGNVNRIP